MARPEKYKSEYSKQAKVACERMGATDEDLALLFNVSRRTINYWKVANEDFAKSIKVGKKPADDKVEMSLYHRAVGYSVPEEVVKVVDGELVTTTITKHYPPDTAACIYWTRNRMPDKWRQNPGENQGTGEFAEAISKLIDKLPG